MAPLWLWVAKQFGRGGPYSPGPRPVQLAHFFYILLCLFVSGDGSAVVGWLPNTFVGVVPLASRSGPPSPSPPPPPGPLFWHPVTSFREWFSSYVYS